MGFLERAPEGKPPQSMQTIICHGDSLTAATDLEPHQGWPALTAAVLKISIINSGIDGDTSGGLLARFQSDVVRHKPDAAVILGGTNDLWWDLEIGQIQANLFAMACHAQSNRIKPVIGLPPPIHLERAQFSSGLQPAAGWEACCCKLSALVDGLRSACRACMIACLDFHSPFRAPDGSVVGELYLPDGLHPNAEGHRRMADAAARLLGQVP